MEQQMSASERYERGLVLKQVKIFDAALEDFQQAANDPQYAGKAHVQIALCFLSTGRHEDAVASLRQALTSPALSSQESVHILYLLGQTLESLGRYAETLEAYNAVRREDAGFRDVVRRIKHLSSGGRGPVPPRPLADQPWVGDMLKVWDDLRLHLPSLLGQTWQSLGRYAETLEPTRWGRRKHPRYRDLPRRNEQPELTPMRRSSPPLSTGGPLLVRRGRMEKRRHARVAIHLRSQFFSKSRMVAGEGELRDLSRGGCRVRSPIAVPVGAELECCIFPQDEVNPFTIDGATVRWSRPQEFGLAFTNVRPGVQRQIAQLCRKATF